jgi:hypothetical protein
VAFWKSLNPGRVMRFGSRELGALARLSFGGKADRSPSRNGVSRPPAVSDTPVAGLMDTTPLHELLQQTIPWRRLQRNLSE